MSDLLASNKQPFMMKRSYHVPKLEQVAAAHQLFAQLISVSIEPEMNLGNDELSVGNPLWDVHRY